ncbi:MAG: M15 family metallopeptidase [Lachnospiraceae bacterium]|nr:M15 family metallopeptidase [Lachnospiraceae bacterium]GFI16969.1 D-alanyl-D-alanine carboxypeptidase [Lachnospiraceae bacterium]
MKRLTCIIFILFCFLIGNSFAYPSSGGMDAPALKDAAEEAGAEPAALPDNARAEVRGGEGQAEALLEETAFDGQDWKLMLINKQHPIPEEYSFTLGTIKAAGGNMKCDERIIKELNAMMDEAGKDGINLAICSPYRDLARQESLFNRKIKAYMQGGMTYMDAYKISSQAVTVPGASEHQAGLALDIISDTYTVLEEGFADTPAGRWLEENCARYGFILRYPEGKELITGIGFEPWHFRYVGREAAEIIMEEEICLEEFWEKYL